MWHNKKKAPEPPERPHFDAIGSTIVLFPGTWYYHISGESFFMDDALKTTRHNACKEAYRKAFNDALDSDVKYCVSRSRVHFIDGWLIQTSRWGYFAKDGREVSQDEVWGHRDEDGDPFKQKEIKLSENEWKTHFGQGIPRELHQKLYGPLKILV